MVFRALRVSRGYLLVLGVKSCGRCGHLAHPFFAEARLWVLVLVSAWRLPPAGLPGSPQVATWGPIQVAKCPAEYLPLDRARLELCSLPVPDLLQDGSALPTRPEGREGLHKLLPCPRRWSACCTRCSDSSTSCTGSAWCHAVSGAQPSSCCIMAPRQPLSMTSARMALTAASAAATVRLGLGVGGRGSADTGEPDPRPFRLQARSTGRACTSPSVPPCQCKTATRPPTPMATRPCLWRGC